MKNQTGLAVAIVIVGALGCLTALVIHGALPWTTLVAAVSGVVLWIARSPFAPAAETLVQQAIAVELAKLGITPNSQNASFDAAVAAGKALVPAAAKAPEAPK